MPPMWASCQTALGAVTAVCLGAKYICLFIIYLCHNSLSWNQTHSCLMHPMLFHLVYTPFQTHNQLCKLAVWHSIGSHMNHSWFVSFVCWIPKTIICACLQLSFQIPSLIWTSVLENSGQKCIWIVKCFCIEWCWLIYKLGTTPYVSVKLGKTTTNKDALTVIRQWGQTKKSQKLIELIYKFTYLNYKYLCLFCLLG